MRGLNAGRIRICVVKPDKGTICLRQIKATDQAWREAMFGIRARKTRIAGARLGLIGIWPVATIVELPSEVEPDTKIWTIRTDEGLFALAGPGAVYNDAGFGPASIGVPLDDLRRRIQFNPDPAEVEEGLARTLAARSAK